MEFLTAELSAQSSLTQIATKALLNGTALFVLANLLKGVSVSGFGRAVIAAAIVAFLNATLGAILDFLSFPLHLLTLGLFGFVVDAALILLAARMLDGFEVRNFNQAILLALGTALFNAILYAVFLP